MVSGTFWSIKVPFVCLRGEIRLLLLCEVHCAANPMEVVPVKAKLEGSAAASAAIILCSVTPSRPPTSLKERINKV